MGFSERQIVIDFKGPDWLMGLAFIPPRPALRCLICNPLFEERKTSQRTLVELARAMAGHGVAVLTFDYRGCGDSSGEFADFSVPDWLIDLQIAQSYLDALAPDCETVYFGLRFGATLATLAAEGNPDVKACCLWSPIVSGKDYLLEELRKKIMKEMLTFGANQSTREELVTILEKGQRIDMDGYALTPRLFDDLCKIDLSSGPAWRQDIRIRIQAIGPGGKLSRHQKDLGKRFENVGGGYEAGAVRMQSFWNQIGRVDCTGLIDSTIEWLRGGLLGE